MMIIIQTNKNAVPVMELEMKESAVILVMMSREHIRGKAGCLRKIWISNNAARLKRVRRWTVKDVTYMVLLH